MNDLTGLAMHAHGGLDRWRQLKTVSAHLVQGGVLWQLKGQNGVLDDVHVTVDLRKEWASHRPFGQADRRSAFQPDRVAIETSSGDVVEERANPRESFRGHTFDTPWDSLQLAYFAGYAMWTYLNTPFLFALPGVETEELESWQEHGEAWRRLKVTFPERIATHSAEQTCLETAPTEFVESAGISFAYRRLGPPTGIPLVLLQHFTGHMDSWDPAVVNGLAKDRPVVVFDNAGVGQSSGATPDNVPHMAEGAARFMSALGLTKVDLLGFSLGGCVAQQMAFKYPDRVRTLVLVGTAPRGGEEHLMEVVNEARSHKDAPDIRLPLFFTPSEKSQAAGRAFLKRASARTADRDPESGDAVSGPQANALITWCASKDPKSSILNAIDHPVLVVCGSDDTMLPDRNAYFMFKHLQNAQLVLYPDSGHGALFQYPELFVNHVSLFLADRT